MRNVAIIGSGIAGCLAALGFLKSGHKVTLYSDRTPDDWLNKSAPTGTAARFARSHDYDVELGVDHWHKTCPPAEGVSLAFGLKPRNRLVTLTAKLPRPGLAMDVRMMSARFMADIEKRGGRVVFENVDVKKLDAIAAEHDITVVAAGRKELCEIFPRNAERSVYEKPQRKLCLVIVRGDARKVDLVPFLPVRFNLTQGVGEEFSVPFLHKSGDFTWNILFEAIPGGPMDRFDDVTDGHAAVARAKEVIKDLAPWDAKWAESMTLADERSWLKGAITPTVREPVATLPSGRVVTAIGDTIISLDPIAGQGANNGTKMARHLVAAVDAHDGPLDAAFMKATFERYWSEQGRHIVRFNNLLLEPMASAGQLLLVSQYGSDGSNDTPAQRIANAFVSNFEDPSVYTDALVDAAATKRIIADSGATHPWRFVAGLAGVARGQVRQLAGFEPGHPAHL